MKKTIKRITGAIMAAAIFAAMTVMSTTASASYIDGDREVDYYRFEFEANYNLDEWPDFTEGIVKRFADRNWVVSVNYVNHSQYDITYWVSRLEGNGGLGATEGIAYTAVLRGTGNTGGRYAINCKGNKIHMFASQRVSAPDGTTIITSGQWSPDAPY